MFVVEIGDGVCGRDRVVFAFVGLCLWLGSGSGCVCVRWFVLVVGIGWVGAWFGLALMLMVVAWVSRWLGFVGLLLWLWVRVAIVVGCGSGVVARFRMILGDAFWLWDGFCGVDVVGLVLDVMWWSWCPWWWWRFMGVVIF